MAREPTPLYLVFDGAALDGLLYRIVESCPPVREDFLSYEMLGRSYDRRDFFKGVGVSMYKTRRRAWAVARHFGLGRGVAALELRNTSAVWARTGRNHFTVWAPAEHLLRGVVQCDTDE